MIKHFEKSDGEYSVNKDHPNYSRWKETKETAMIRGRLVVRLLQPLTAINGAGVLDVGCGDGGTSIAFAEQGAAVVAADADPRRVRSTLKFINDRGKNNLRISVCEAMAEKLPFTANAFDIVNLQGVLEHTQDPVTALNEISRVLKPGGFAFMTVPNRFALFNIAADPHWGLPFVALARRPLVGFIITKIIRREKFRPDFAQLISLPQLKKFLEQSNLVPTFLNKEAAREMFLVPESVVWTKLEREIVSTVRRTGLDGAVVSLVNNDWGFSNFFFTPTWYLAGQKRNFEITG